MPRCRRCKLALEGSCVSRRGLCTKCELVRVEIETKHEQETSEEYMTMNFTLQGSRINRLSEATDSLDTSIRDVEERLSVKMREIENSIVQLQNIKLEDVSESLIRVEEMKLVQKQEETKQQQVMAELEIERVKLAQKQAEVKKEEAIARQRIEETNHAKERTRQEQIRKERDIQLERIKKQHNNALAKKDREIQRIKRERDHVQAKLFHSESSQRSEGSVDEIYELNQNLSESQDYWNNRKFKTNIKS